MLLTSFKCFSLVSLPFLRFMLCLVDFSIFCYHLPCTRFHSFPLPLFLLTNACTIHSYTKFSLQFLQYYISFTLLIISILLTDRDSFTAPRQSVWIKSSLPRLAIFLNSLIRKIFQRSFICFFYFSQNKESHTFRSILLLLFISNSYLFFCSSLSLSFYFLYA